MSIDCDYFIKFQVDLSGGAWRQVSNEARNCVRRMLQLEPALRPRASDLLREAWLMPGHAHAVVEPLEPTTHDTPPAADLRRAVDLTFQVCEVEWGHGAGNFCA